MSSRQSRRRRIEPPGYWKGHNPEEDERLVLDLLNGRHVWTRGEVRHEQSPCPEVGEYEWIKAGRLHHEYLSDNNERAATIALKRLMSYPARPLNSTILSALAASLDPDGSSERQLILKFKFRKRGNRHVRPVSDHQIASHVSWRVHVGDPGEAAVQDAMTTYGLSRKTVYEIMRRVKELLPSS
jgi:hypothetical protein